VARAALAVCSGGSSMPCTALAIHCGLLVVYFDKFTQMDVTKKFIDDEARKKPKH